VGGRRSEVTESGSAPTLPATPISGERAAAPVLRESVPGPETAGDEAAIRERMGALVDRESRGKYRARLLFTIRVGAWVWVAWFLLDLYAWHIGADPLWLIVVGRFAPLLVGLGLMLDLHRRPEPSRRRMQVYEMLTFVSAMVGSTLIYVAAGGWGAARLPAASLILMAHAIMIGSSLRYSWVPVVSMTLALPATLGVATAFVPELQAQLRDPVEMQRFFQGYSIVVGAAMLSLFGGHGVYKLRQEVAAAKSVGRYRLRHRIATGGMGEVWAAYHAGLGRDVALKLVTPSLGEDSVSIARFEREVRTLAELTHPNIVRVFDYGATEAGVWYYAMELLEAQDLQSIVDRDGPLAPDRALRLLVQASEALGEAHARNIVHRDLKPANLLVVEPEGVAEFVKVIDFGIAAQDGGASLTRTGMVVGTPGFIAPETLRGDEATPRSDVYSLGVTLYVLLTGTLAHGGRTPKDLVDAALERDVDPPSAVRPDLPEPIDAVVMRCLSRDPMARFANASELARALRLARARL